MTKPIVISQRDETPAEAAQRAWFEKQALAAPDNLEAAARQLITLGTSLLGVLFGVLSIAGDPLPSYLAMPVVRGLGMAVVVLLLVSLWAALFVVLPRRGEAASGVPASQAEVFQRLLRRKSRALTIAVWAFGLALVCLGAVLVIALGMAV